MTIPTTGDRVLVVIRQHIAYHGYSPSIREIVADAGLSSTAVAWYWLRKHRRDGLVTWVPGQKRTLRFIGDQSDDDLVIRLRGDQAKLIREACGDHDASTVAGAYLVMMAQSHRMHLPTNGHAAPQGVTRRGGPRA